MASKKTKITKSTRPPVVTLMGHVDHGKTTLLDAIRKSDLAAKEHGGITQHIGAYQVSHKQKKITFIDTPGHAAFAKMRAQGAQVTDIVVLVVAANDGVKPQTREALAHIKSAQAPYLVAINKIDLPQANVERVKGQLAEAGVVVESYGGDIVTVEVSAKTGKNIDQLLDMILLVSDLTPRLADPQAKLEAVVIETRQDKQRGILATLLLKNGSLSLGDIFQANGQRVRAKSLIDENGKLVKKVGPSMPVEILGFKKLPVVGQLIGKTEKPKKKHPGLEEIKIATKKSLTKKEAKEDEVDVEKEDEDEEKQSIKILIKADTLGTLEAITSNLSEEVEIIGKGVGEVTESDILLAQATDATVFVFNTKISTSARKLAEIEKVNIKTYKIIYKLFEDLEKQVLKMLEPTIDEEVVGKAEIVEEFRIHGEAIAGCKVTTGEINKNLPIHLERDGEIIADTKIKSLMRGKEAITKAKAGSECGMTFKPQIDFRAKDAILSYRNLGED